MAPTTKPLAKSAGTLTALRALQPLVEVAKRDGPALLSDLIATARNHTIDPQVFARVPTALKVLHELIELLLRLPDPAGVVKGEDSETPFVASPTSPRAQLLEMYARAPHNDPEPH